jgi:hypothetical protein
MVERMNQLGCSINTLLTDTGFSSGENYAALEAMNLEGFIPVHGGYRPYREGFDYDATTDS